jgi:surface protein
MRRITHIGPTPLAGENSGVTGLDHQFQFQQANAWLPPTPPALPPMSYTRPGDWLTLPDVGPMDQVFYGLFAIWNHDSNYVNISASNDFTIDWGDGSPVNTYTSGSNQVKIYDFAAFDNSTLTSDGFKQVIITVRPAPGKNLTALYINVHDENFGGNNSQWLDINIAGRFLGDLNVSRNGLTSRYLQGMKIEKNNLQYWNYQFNGCESLENVRYIDTGQAVDTTAMFYYCRSLQSIPALSTSKVTTMNNMFYQCARLQNIPQMDTGNSLNFVNFVNGTSISSLRNIVTKQGVNFNGAFANNPYLTDLSGLDTSSATDVSSIFSGCNSLRSVPSLDLTNVAGGFGSLFQFTYNLEIVYPPKMPTGSPSTNNQNIFQFSGIERLAWSDWSYVLNGDNMFWQTPRLLSSAVAMNFPNAVSAHQMFSGWGGTVPVFTVNAPLVTDASGICAYSGFNKIVANLPSATDLSIAFVQNYSLTDLEITTSPALTSVVGMFDRTGIQYPPALDLTNVTDCTDMYGYSQVRIPPASQDMSNVTNLSNCFDNSTVYSIPAYNWSNVTNFSNAFNATPLTDLQAYGMRYSMTLPSYIGQIAAEYIVNNLGSAHNASQTITFQGPVNRSQSPVSLAATTTAGSKLVTMGNTSGLVTGMFVTGSNISDPVAVTFTDSGDTVNLNNHGLANDTAVGFTSITSTTGISTYTVYYVVNAATNTFQVSLTKGGSAINLVNDGSGSLYYPSYLTNIVPNTSITLSAPASASGATTISATYFNYALARIKGWTVSF